MTDEQAIAIIENEFRQKTLGVTEQYLEIHSPVYTDNKIKVDRIDRERNDDVIIAYLPVLSQRFYFAVYIDKRTNTVTGVTTEAYHRVYFKATSTSLTTGELQAMTVLTPTATGNKEGIFVIQPNPEPDEFEDKLKKLLDHLEQDREGVKRLVDNANGYIQVVMEIHNGNGMLGGPHVDKVDIGRMNELGLSINFDLYVSGNSFKE